MHTVKQGRGQVNIEQLKYSVNRMPPEAVLEAALALRLEGLVLDHDTPFGKVHFNACFAEIEALFQRAGYHRGLDVVGYEGTAYALYDPSRWEPVQVLRKLRSLCEAPSVPVAV
ncbi:MULTISPECIES: transcriptional regulator [unclassified Pseudomonas]|uniref:transcriptional regulator n=1 Tax=unclassified Pseudomonas TaxID=196821 RepID=UPI000BCEB675|nr:MULTISPECIES: transcriptional regulator [unclassified Pseudomonas]PVZ20358.1 hypothetical protein F474_00958 [Pseudomonas sp. URIL14HWK12:I12]PVZ27424.1 hypothetical protein F470_00613 [Pseudomonas sp. URIL14HWK12:I10]PVZ38313.1 hypothetical protein F472_00958 [Pseudomonas sp. URIL14HWK12:I11]SNZ03858.1 hypothetical protein SAMN05660463_00446 [Pseudomonas sp. URIL14HWK12:I9]